MEGTSKLATVRTALLTKPEVILVKEESSTNEGGSGEHPKRIEDPEVLLKKYADEKMLFDHVIQAQPAENRGRYIATVKFYVAPRPGCYEQSALNEFLRALVPLPHIWPDGMNPFLFHPPMNEAARARDRYLTIGNLVFEEGVGEQTTRTITTYRFTDEELSKTTGLEDEAQAVKAVTEEHRQPLKRIIFVYAFPDERFAKAALEKQERDRESPSYEPEEAGRRDPLFRWMDIPLTNLQPHMKKQSLLQSVWG